MRFFSDGSATACPEIMQAIAAANHGLVLGYGDDPWTRQLDAVYGEFFGAPVRVFPVSTGTAANSLALATVTPPWGAVFAHEEAHILRDECSAPEFFSGGARIIPLPGQDAKLTPEVVAPAIGASPSSVHSVQPAALSITQSTERGTVYRPAEIEALSRIARARGLVLHLDGARIANALVTLGCAPADITWRAGVDVLSFGATKNGTLTAEAVVFFREELVREFELRRKRAGHLLAKSRYISAQLLAYIETGVWRRNAQRANGLAQQIAAVAQPWLLHPVEANQVFLQLGDAGKQALRDQGFMFYDWGAADSGIARFVTAWDQDEASVRELVDALQRLARTGAARA
ncbi:MAG: low specificity L-threonine aldolase [Steroidobacteraceae bacterium]